MHVGGRIMVIDTTAVLKLIDKYFQIKMPATKPAFSLS